MRFAHTMGQSCFVQKIALAGDRQEIVWSMASVMGAAEIAEIMGSNYFREFGITFVGMCDLNRQALSLLFFAESSSLTYTRHPI
jgi:hypothetical protein